MARILAKDVKGLPVFTKSGDRIGKVADFVIDAERHEIVEYVVSKSNLLAALLPGDLHIARDQVIELTDERLTVRDASVGDRVAEELLPKEAAFDATPRTARAFERDASAE